jgi:hypothetical protein
MMTSDQTSVAAVVKRGFFFAFGVYLFRSLVSAIAGDDD